MKSAFLPQVFTGIITVAFGITGGGILLLNGAKAYLDEIENIKIDGVIKSEMAILGGWDYFLRVLVFWILPIQ